jgi:hypothetical protein
MFFKEALGAVVAVAISMLALEAMADTIVTGNVSVAGCNACASPGAIPVIQVENALGGAVQGANADKPANSGRRTAYYWQPDITAANTAPSYGISFGDSWAVIFHDGGNLVVDPSVAASVTLGAVQATGLVDGLGNSIDRAPVLVNNLPIYQFYKDSQEGFSAPYTDIPEITAQENIAGIYGTWYGVGASNGAVVIPEPSTALLLGGGLSLLAWRRKES